jgi:hypothetical protein
MNNAAQRKPTATPRSTLGLFQPIVSSANIAWWRIDGHRASVIVWTTEEFDRLVDRPADAQFYPCGVWCALRWE